MTSAETYPDPPGEQSPDAAVDALRDGDPAALSAMLGDLAFLLQHLASDPGTLFDIEGRQRREFTHLLGALQGSRGALDSLEARAVTALQDLTRRDRWDAARDRAAHEGKATPSQTRVHREADGATIADITLLTRRSPHMAGRTLACARRLVETLPEIMAALADGRIAGDAAYAVADASAVLDPEIVGEVDRALGEKIPELDGAGVRRWRDQVATTAGELDPEGAALRHRKARTERHVSMTPGQHGMATVSARLTALDAQQIYRRLSLEAERRRAEGSRIGHGAAMADALTDQLLRPEDQPAPVSLEVGVIVTDRALFRPDSGDVAHLEGYGAVPAEAVRAQLRGALKAPGEDEDDPYGEDGDAVRVMFRRLYTHPTTGELVAMDATSRAFPPAMRRFLRWRDTSCRGPYCNAAIRQNDHIVPVSRGGTTSLDNGQGLCAHCNQKERDTAAVERIEDGEGTGHRVRWTGLSGVSRETGPTPLLPPRPPQPPEPPQPPRPPQPPLRSEEESGEESASSAAGPERTSSDDAPSTEPPSDETRTSEPSSTEPSSGGARRIPMSLTRPRRPRAAGRPEPPRRTPPPPARSARGASAGRGRGRGRRGGPSGRRRGWGSSADDPDH